jgi:hypothetical protein
MYLGDRRIFFQLIGLYSVSSGTVSFFWPRIASISMSVSRFLNNPMTLFVCLKCVSIIAMLVTVAVSRCAQPKGVGKTVVAESAWTNMLRVGNKGRGFGVSKVGAETGIATPRNR